LTLSADGYEDAEVFTPKVTELKTIKGIVVKLKKKAAGTRPTVPRQRITGTVARSGRPVKTGWVSLWAVPWKPNVVNAYILRGRTVRGGPFIPARAPIRDGKYSIEVPFQDKKWYVAAEEPGQPLTQVGPIAVELNEEKTLNIACTPGGSIAGRVQNVPQGWRGHLWVVAFTKTGIRYETRVREDGSFLLASLPPGEFGLKVGHDAYDDSEVPRDLRTLTKENWQKSADPWKRAKIVNVKPDRGASGIELEFPVTESPH
jgi:hypothetical protein